MIAQYASAAADPASTAAQRVASMIEAARQELGPDPAVLPLGSDPMDWAEAGADCWRVFDKQVTTSITTTTEGQPAPPH